VRDGQGDKDSEMEETSGEGAERNESDRHNDDTERVPNPPAPNHQHHALNACEVLYKPPVGATSHSGNGPVDHENPPYPLPTTNSQSLPLTPNSTNTRTEATGCQTNLVKSPRHTTSPTTTRPPTGTHQSPGTNPHPSPRTHNPQLPHHSNSMHGTRQASSTHTPRHTSTTTKAAMLHSRSSIMT
jgi:hypothetical protein